MATESNANEILGRNNLVQVELEYVYITIPAEYICIYHRILAMLADLGEDMLKDCKASCTKRNTNVIECKLMFDAAVAARKLGKTKLAETLIKSLKAKINLIYKGVDNSTSFVFPVDENGQLKAFVSCGERPRFEINPDDMSLYEHKFDNGFDEHFRLGNEDMFPVDEEDHYDLENQYDEENQDFEEEDDTHVLNVNFTPSFVFNTVEERYTLEGNLFANYDGEQVDLTKAIVQYYVDEEPVIRLNDIVIYPGVDCGRTYNIQIVVTYKNITKVVESSIRFWNDSCEK